MKKLIFSLVLAAVILDPLSLFAPVYANYDGDIDLQTETRIYRQSGTMIFSRENADFSTLDESELNEYFLTIAAMAEVEEYPHFLAENSQRYEDFQTRNPDMSFGTVIALVNVNTDKEHYSDILPVPDPYSVTLLVNKHFSLPSEWAPEDFVDIGGGHLMREESAEHFLRMREAISKENLNLTIIITYRSYTSQRNHFNNAVARHGRANAEGGNARPGHSEHQTGLAVDVLHRWLEGDLMMNMRFENSAQFSWLVENAHEFGFIQRYPRGYRSHHGFMFEPWHWRYVGIPIATVMFREDIPTYEEFYGRYLVQGVRDKVNDYVAEQQRLAEEAAEAAEAAAMAAAQQAAAEELAALQAAAKIEELAAMTVAIATHVESVRTSAEQTLSSVTENSKATASNRHFLEAAATLGISAIVLITYLLKKRNRHRRKSNAP